MRILDGEYEEVISDEIPNDCLLTVYCITYNHRRYIKKALDGFLRQKTNFHFKVLIIDDASNDGTTDIIRDYQRMHPDIFELLIAKENMYKTPQRDKIYRQIKQKYITTKYFASCEGDDFWIDSNKLQIQIDYLQSHPECSLYIHNAVVFDSKENEISTVDAYPLQEGNLSFEQIVMEEKGHPPTASFVARAKYFFAEDFYFDGKIGDYAELIWAIANGDVHYSSRVMSVYNFRHPGSYTDNIEKIIPDCVLHYVDLLWLLWNYSKILESEQRGIVRKRFSLWELALFQVAHGFPAIEKQVTLFSNDHKEHANEISMLKKVLKEDYCRIHEPGFLSEEATRFVTTSQGNIYIMGTGDFATRLTNTLLNKGINFDGYAVTNPDKNPQMFFGKPVVALKDIRGNDSLLVGISPGSDESVEASLHQFGIQNYCKPFGLTAPELI